MHVSQDSRQVIAFVKTTGFRHLTDLMCDLANDLGQKRRTVMGGPGSGRINWDGRKLTTEDVCSISITQIASMGLLSDVGGAKIDLMRNDKKCGSIIVHSWHTCIALLSDDESAYQFPAYISQSVDIVRTPCNFGGSRPWFNCPQCGTRVGVLYFAAIRVSWEIKVKVACRICHELQYACQLESKFEQACRRIRKIQRRLGHPDWYNVIDRYFPRPKGMHKRTYYRQLKKAAEALSVARSRSFFIW